VVSADADLVITLALTAQTISIGGIHSWVSGCATRWGRAQETELEGDFGGFGAGSDFS
jgi:hypothetical protein